MDINAVRALFRVALQDRSEPLWFPALTKPLAQVAWERLERDTGLDYYSYGTARMLLNHPRGERSVVAGCSAASSKGIGVGAGDIRVEILPPDVALQIAGLDVRFLDAHRVGGATAHQLEEALSLLDLVPTVWPTVCTLVRSLHIIDPSGDDTDVSFSDPALPFSAFVSVPRVWSDVAALRVAEAILHEAMHLQLTLAEQVVPLVLPQRAMYYSPWRDEPRDSEGILQAVYVFGVIRSFLRAIPVGRLNPVNDHVANRIAQISSQMEQSRDFRTCDELTPDGAALVDWLLDITD